MHLLLHNIITDTPLTKWDVVLLSILVILIFYVIKRYHADKKMKKADRVNEVIWNNVQEYLFLMDSELKIRKTNFFKKNNIPADKMKVRFGEVLGCRYAYDAGNCGKHKSCSVCRIQKQLRESMLMKRAFSNSDVVMELYSPSHNKKELYNVMVSGAYLNLDGEDFILLTVHDISREKKLEKKIKRGTEKFLSVFNNLPVGCIICDNDGMVREVNDTSVQYLGVESATELVDKVSIFDNPCIDDEFKDMMRKGMPIFGEVKYDYHKINEHYIRTKNTTTKYYRFIVDYLKDAGGEVELYVVIMVDNTLIHQTLRKNQVFEDMTELASRVSNIGFGLVNIVNKEQTVTPGFLKNLGLDPDSTSYVLDTYANLHPSDRHKVISYLNKARKEPCAPFEEEIRVYIEGAYHWIKQLILQQEFKPESESVLLLGVNIDISQQKRNELELKEAKEKAESSNKLKTAFIANMSHEIRTPLNAIVGFSDLLINTQSLEEKKGFHEIIHYNNEILLQLISDILDLSKIEADTLEFNWTEVDINNLFTDIEQLIRMKNEQHTEVEIKFIPGLKECVIYTERTRISQVMMNFLTNAAKFTEKGSIDFGYRKTADGLFFYVKDTGVGIPEDKLLLVFDRFVKLDSFKQGTGLGLSICQSLVNKLGGKIGVSSVWGEGTEFWFTLPCQEIGVEETPDPNAVEEGELDEYILPEPEDTAEKHTLLIAEDIEDNFRLCEVLLANRYHLLHAWNGEEAVDLFLKHSPSAVLMDIRMPSWDGYEAAQAIRQIAPHIPIIAITAYALEEDKEKMLSGGFDVCVTKPLNGKELYAALERVNL